MFCCCDVAETSTHGVEEAEKLLSVQRKSAALTFIDVSLFPQEMGTSQSTLAEDESQGSGVIDQPLVPTKNHMGEVTRRRPRLEPKLNTTRIGPILEFRLPAGNVTAVDFSNAQWLGIDFRKPTRRAKDIQVATVREGGRGEELGVQPGWTLISINKWTVTGAHADIVFDELRNAMKVEDVKTISTPRPESQADILREGPILDFELPGGHTTSLDFSNAPALGIDFCKREGRTTAIQVAKVLSGGRGEELGVQRGWTLMSINKWLVKDVRTDLIFDELRKTMDTERFNA